ncbi:MAG: polyphosphate kinase 1 [Bacteroidales bacterium]|nr:polyphosphate kinase 1 [Bacteroidales bacterium]
MSLRFKYFNRDISWLAFNYRVLEEAKDTTLPIYEQMSFLARYSSNLDEFYRVRVAAYRNAADSDASLEDVTNPTHVLSRINQIVSAQIFDMSDILRDQLVPELLKHNVTLFIGQQPDLPEHKMFVHDYFLHEVIAYLQPVLLTRGTRTFLRDNRPYLALKLFTKHKRPLKTAPRPSYALVKLPFKDAPYFNDLPRFVELPQVGEMRYIMFLDDVIRFNLSELFPGYDIEGAWSIKVNRDADLGIDEIGEEDLVQVIKQNLARRSTGLASSIYHDRTIAPDLLKCLKKTFGFSDAEMVESGRYLNLHHFDEFPRHLIPAEALKPLQPIHPRRLQNISMFDAIRQGDQVIHYPYQSFDYVIRLLSEAAIDANVTEIKVTQYRVATNSAVVDSLIAAAHNNKRVTVFVELKARFDEQNNLQMSERMKEAGINIIYSIPGLKVHAKMALINRVEDGRQRSYAYLSTGNFNEKTARQYTDHGLFTCDEAIVTDLQKAFLFLENQSSQPVFNKLLLSQVNMFDRLMELIDREISIARQGRDAYIVLKMNGLQYRPLINKLYEASCAGVRVNLIIRGICCLVPQQEFSSNIHIIRIVDRFLEHGRVWLFHNDGADDLYLTSADLLNRNLKRRIELAFPVENQSVRNEIISILRLQLADNVKARVIDDNLDGHIPPQSPQPIRSQEAIYRMLLSKETV